MVAIAALSLGLTETRIGKLDVPVVGRQSQDIGGYCTFDNAIGLKSRGSDTGEADGECREDRELRLPCIRRAVSEIGIGRLKPLVVEKSDLNRRFDVDGLACHQRFYPVAGCLSLLPVLHPDGLFACRLGALERCVDEARIVGRIAGGGAACCQERKDDGGNDPDVTHDHHAHPFFGAWASLRPRQGLGSTGRRCV